MLYICINYSKDEAMEQELSLLKPPTEEEIMLIQPNNVTFGQYSISGLQENILTLISDKLQKHMSREEELPKDLLNQPYITIKCDDACGKNNKAKVLQEASGLTKKTFSFRWIHPKIHKTIETTGVIITTAHNLKGTNMITLNINPWAIPFLIYYGVGVGGTRFSKTTALTLRGNYTKRLYKIICSQRDRKQYYYPIHQLRKDLDIPEAYSNCLIEQKILRPARDRIKESGSEVWFDYELICKHPVKGRKPKSDTVVFNINCLHPLEEGGEHKEQYSFVYNFLSAAMDYPTDSTVVDILNKIVEKGRLIDIYNKCCYYDDQICSGEMTRKHAGNTLLKILRDEFQRECPSLKKRKKK